MEIIYTNTLNRGDFVRYRLLYVLLLCIIASGCSTKNDLISRLTKFSTIQAQSEAIGDNLTILNSKTSIRGGEFGFITIQGQPGIKYKISTLYKKGNRTLSVTQWRVTDARGQATFNWFVDSDTTPGTYSATISGGGKTINTYHTVNP